MSDTSMRLNINTKIEIHIEDINFLFGICEMKSCVLLIVTHVSFKN